MSKGNKKKKGDDEDVTTLRLLPLYKKKCDFLGVTTTSKGFKELVDLVLANDEHLQKLHLWDDLGPLGVRSIFEVFCDLSYQHLKSIKLWRVRANNEGVRNLCNFVIKAKTVEHLDLLDNGITALGCEFIGKLIHPFAEVPIKTLILDHNPIGTEGLKNLSDGFCMNAQLEELSLNFCSIDSDGAKYIQQLLAFINSNLKILKLQGNLLKNTGVFNIMEALVINRMLDKLVLADNQIGESDENSLIQKFIDVLKKNDNLMKLDIRFNGFYEDEFKRLFEVMKLGYLTRLKVTEQLPKLLMDDYLATIKKNEKFVKKLRKKRNKKKKKK